MSELRLENVIVEYPDFKLDISFCAKEGEFVSVIGPSGSGKSTILSLIAGLIPVKKGNIILGERDITKEKIQKRHVGFVFQDYALFENMNVARNILYALKFHKMTRKERKETLSLLLSLVDLEGFEKRKIATLSGGQCQRVALARALATSPEVLLLDEPLSALDASLRRHLKNEIRRIHDHAGGMTTIYVTHDIEEAMSISDRIVIIKDGKVEMNAKPEEIYHNPATLFTATFSGDGTALPASLFSDNSNFDTIFFRPEAVRLNEGQFHGDFEMHLCLDYCSVLSAEYLGSKYLVRLDFRGHEIKAETFERPSSKYVSVYIRKPMIIFFKDGKRVD